MCQEDNLSCLNGFPCNATRNECDCANDLWFVHDTVLFRNNNCGLPVVALYLVYIISSLLGISAGTWSLIELRNRTLSTKYFLGLGVIWCYHIPILALSHYLEGYRLGPGSVFVLFSCLLFVNTQVVVFSFQIFSLLAVLADPTAIRKLRRFLGFYLLFWSTFKIVPFIIIEIAISLNSWELFNQVVLLEVIALMVEVSVTTTGQAVALRKLIKMLGRVESSSFLSQERLQAIREFGKRLNTVLPVAVSYAILVGMCGVVILVLFIVFDENIPHAWIIYALLVTSWPTLAIECVLLMRDPAVKKLEAIDGEPSENTFSVFGVDPQRAIRDENKVIIATSLTPTIMNPKASNHIREMVIEDSTSQRNPLLNEPARQSASIKSSKVASESNENS